jgi:hypothetical protein
MPAPTPAPAWTVYHRRIPEEVVPGKRLGRHERRDSRSAGYPYRSARPEASLTDTLLTRHIPILDQGNLGSCEGNSEVGEQGTDPFYSLVPKGTVLDEALAVKLYSAAEKIDGGQGYPPEDEGTSNLSMAKAAQQAGLISGYQDAATVQDIAAALQVQPVRIGINWYSSFDSPASSGLISISRNAYVRGGHALVLRGVQVAARLFKGDNSWAESWGDKGSFEISWDTLARLLAEGGEATVSVPVSQPAPTPVPVPTPPPPAPGDLPADVQAYLADPKLAAWASARHVTSNAYAAKAYATLKAAHS